MCFFDFYFWIREVIVKCQAQYYNLLAQVLNNIKAFKPLISCFVVRLNQVLDHNSQLTLNACDLRQKNRMTLVEKNKNLSLTALTKICLIVFPKSHWANSGVSF